jgi:hypothetical protein
MIKIGKNIIVKTCDEVIPFLKRVKTFKRLSKTTENEIEKLIQSNREFKSLKNDFLPFIKKHVLKTRSGKFKPEELIEIFGWTEEEVPEYNEKWKYEVSKIDDFVPHLKLISKSFVKLTPIVIDRLHTLLTSNKKFSSKQSFYDYLKENILCSRSGTYNKEQYEEIFGWNKENITELMEGKANVLRTYTGCLSPALKEFWMKYHGMSEKEAKEKVSEHQRNKSIRKKKTKINQPTSLDYYLNRGIGFDEAIKLQSDLQKKRRKNCVEYWIHRGYSLEEAKNNVSAIQRKNSQYSLDYWLYRGYSLEEAKTNSVAAHNKNSTGKISKISQKFFEEVISALELLGFNKSDFMYGANEACVFLSNKRRFYIDLLYVPTKTIIEFDGKYWHLNSKNADNIRDATLVDLGYRVLRVKETYNFEEWNKYKDQAVSFIKDYHENS